MSFKVEVVPSPKSDLGSMHWLCHSSTKKLMCFIKIWIGEGPHWDEATQSLYYNDIYGKEESILRYDFKENKVYSAKIDGEPVVSFILPVANTTDQYAVGIGRRVGIVQWDGVSPYAKLGQICFEVDEEDKNRFNDAKADPVGRFYGGTMHYEDLGDLFDVAAGTFYRYIKGEGVKDLLHNIHVSNGLAWNEKEKKFYFIDSCKWDVKEYDYDQKSGDICKLLWRFEPKANIGNQLHFFSFSTANERVAISFKDGGKKPDYIPDGMTIDAEGNLYVATWGGSKVLKVDPK